LFDTIAEELIAVAAAQLSLPLPEETETALDTWLTRAWGLLQTHSGFLNPALFADRSDRDVVTAHEPVVGSLHRILEHLDAATGLPGKMSVEWAVAAIIALGHAASQEVACDRMTLDDAGQAFRASALRLCLPQTRS